MKLADLITPYINAAFTGLWVQTHEPDEAERELIRHAREKEWKVAAWDVANGLRVDNSRSQPQAIGAGEPLAALRALPSLGVKDGTAILLLHNFHRFLTNPEVIQATIQQILAGKRQRTFVVVLSPVVQIPVELEKLFVVLEHALPDREQLEGIARELTSDHPEDLPKGEELHAILEAAAGLTRYEAEGAFALSLARHNQIRLETIWELKAQAVKKSGLATIYRGDDTFDSLGGMDALKNLCRKALRPGCPVPAKGFILLSPPGCGKTSVAKAIGGETRRRGAEPWPI